MTNCNPGIPSGRRSYWDHLVEEAVEAFDAGRLENFQLPDDVAAHVPARHRESARTMILAAAFERWLKKEFRRPMEPPQST